MRLIKKVVGITLFLLAINISILWAQWTNDPMVNTVVNNYAEDQRETAIVGNTLGQIMLFWRDYRNETSMFGGDIYMQTLDSSGNILLAADGSIIYSGINGQFNPKAISDGHNGAVVAWLSNHGGFYENDVYARRLSADGALLWPANGVPVSVMSGTASSMAMVSDNAGGAIIVWQYLTENYDIYAQRIDSSGTVLWGNNGLTVCTAAESQMTPAVSTDDSGGAIIVWQDSRNGAGNTDIYAQRINAEGQVQWAVDGLAVCAALHNQQYPQTVADGSGGMLLCWQDDRNGDLGDIYAQRVSGSGSVLWNAGGGAICLAGGYQTNPALIGDGQGGAVVAWEDQRGGADFNIYAQWIDANGDLAGITAIGAEYPPQPTGFTLYQNYPNPFNPETAISCPLSAVCD